MKETRIPVFAEAIYVIGLLLLSLSVAMIASTGFGVSMVVAPAYILSLKWTALTFGQWEYVVQGVLFIAFCVLMRRVKLVYFSSFLTGVIYGALLDLWRLVIPHFNPAVTPPGTLSLPLCIVYFVIGMLLTAVSVAILFRTYFYPQVYDFFVKGISERFHFDRSKCKIVFDVSCLVVSCGLTLLLFGRPEGIGIGTIVMTVCNGLLIAAAGKGFDRLFSVVPAWPSLAARFSIL
ncbi:MAG: hypothetical protein IJU16_05890 [Clostridia bacterium]|nr:hypothetical protein [Clostridia bacterium]